MVPAFTNVLIYRETHTHNTHRYRLLLIIIIIIIIMPIDRGQLSNDYKNSIYYNYLLKFYTFTGS